MVHMPVRRFQKESVLEWSVLVVLVLAMFLSERVGWLGPVERWLETGILPIKQSMAASAHVMGTPVRLLGTEYERAVRIQELEFSYAAALAQLSELERLRRENDALRQLLEADSEVNQERRVAPVVSYATPTIGIGAQSGIQVGDLVLYAGTLLGQIRSVTQQQAELALLRSGGVQIVARTEGGVQGIVAAEGKQLLLQEVPRGQQVQVGERVVTVGQTGVQSDLFVGQVVRVETLPTAPTQTIVLDQFISLYDVAVVEVW